MRARSAYIRSFGVTGILVAAALLMLAIVSAIVAFDRWPDSAVSSRVESVALAQVGSNAPSPEVVRVRTERHTAARPVRARRTAAPRRSPRDQSAPRGPRTSSPAPTAQATVQGKPPPHASHAQPNETALGTNVPPPPAAPDPATAVAGVSATFGTVTGSLTGMLEAIVPRH
jgi:hypothetical protein